MKKMKSTIKLLVNKQSEHLKFASPIDIKRQLFLCKCTWLSEITFGLKHTCTARHNSSHLGQDGACPQSSAHPPPLSGHLSVVEPKAGAAQLLLGYGSLRAQKHVTHLSSHNDDYSKHSQIHTVTLT